MIKFSMDKKTVKTIKEVIEDLLAIRKKELVSNMLWSDGFAYKDDKATHTEDRKRRKNRIIELYDVPLIKLNKILEQNEQFDEVNDIEYQMKKIQSKKYITTKEMEDIYNISISSQKDYRGRLNDPLPFHQKVVRGKITYIVEEIEKWLQNQHK